MTVNSHHHLKNKFQKLVLCCAFFWLCWVSVANADNFCKGHFFNPFTDICWECFFPLTIGSMKVVSGQNPDTPNPGNPICHCGADPFNGWGLAVGFWAPSALVDVTRHPYCLVNVGGWQLHNFSGSGTGQIANYSSNNNQSFYYFHYISFPLLDWFPIISGGSCKDPSSFGLGYLSELDPLWHDEKLDAIFFPENTFVSQHILVAQVGHAADCAAATTHLPLDNLFWAAGCQGSLYPVTGEVSEYVDSAQASALISERGVLRLHQLTLMEDSSKDNLCREKAFFYPPYLPKSRYRYQMIYPVNKKAYPFGRTTTLWAKGVTTPLRSEDYGYMIWKKRNCCAY